MTSDEIIVSVFQRQLGITFGEDGKDAEAAWEHLEGIQTAASRVHSDPNYVKSGYAPRKDELARQVDAVSTLAFHLVHELRKAEASE